MLHRALKFAPEKKKKKRIKTLHKDFTVPNTCNAARLEAELKFNFEMMRANESLYSMPKCRIFKKKSHTPLKTQKSL